MSRACLKGRAVGKVQGVGFRQSTVSRARQLGLVGWVRNLPDGSVEVLFAGEQAAVDALREWLQNGPCGARVDQLLLESCTDEPGNSFVRR